MMDDLMPAQNWGKTSQNFFRGKLHSFREASLLFSLSRQRRMLKSFSRFGPSPCSD